MKTRKLKFLIPVMAIGLAITASAFTSMEKSHVGESNLIVGYVYDSPANPCDQKLVDCNETGENLCYSEGQPVFKMEGTSCITQLRRD
ncbi:hypothetical protein D2V08_01180 [Flagellimonas lutimaris]|jgi:hypothetical protein|uniref:Uncharacterized protein n=1 Tax=Flagellimonas lutimaris TaxID=475082 RepID=A0A3A1NEB5_9FLAO|nr:DUF6520 family protein [Allomuricauda lutimaris]RIV37502.1 hypothetical protein D2V08_01180 [Allomuricauda lutimaris]